MFDFIKKKKKIDKTETLEISGFGEIVRKLNDQSSFGLKLFSHIRENDALKFTASEALENAFVEEHFYLFPQYRQGEIVAYEASLETSFGMMGKSFSCRSDIINTGIVSSFVRSLVQLQNSGAKFKDASFLLEKINNLPIKYEDDRAQEIYQAITNYSELKEEKPI